MARRKRTRRYSLRELAIGWAVLGSLLATCVPPFVHELHASPLHEVEEALPRLAQAVLAYHAEHHQLPGSVPLTPATPARGAPRVDPPGTWDHPVWLALGFAPVEEGAAHMISFAYENQGSSFTVEARGDLDGDGSQSSFVLRGVVVDGVARLEPGMHVERELE